MDEIGPEKGESLWVGLRCVEERSSVYNGRRGLSTDAEREGEREGPYT